ncbi:MAG: precorrin-6y C5,15-methyltransferase (decarboxylating) subunit CbiE [Pseudomonadota bacterium]
MADPAWLTVLGIGDNGLESLTPAARRLFDASDSVIAPERVLAEIPETELDGKEVTPWTSRVHETLRNLKERRGEALTILATGDPMHFGIGATLSRVFEPEEMRILPHPSGFSLAATRLCWPLQDVACISLHGRAVGRLHAAIEPGQRILALTSNATTIGEAVAILNERGFGESKVSVLEHIGGKAERIVSFRADTMPNEGFADFNMLAIDCKPGSGAVIRPRTPGLPDDAFVHDGQMTKREARAVTLAALEPFPDAVLWDIGAGCGSVAIEWMRSARGAKAVCFEQDQNRLAMLSENAHALGVPDIKVVEGRFPESIEDKDPPDAVFIGGGLSEDAVFDAAWKALKTNGRLVANTVTLEGEAKAISLQEAHGGELVRLDVSILAKVGKMRALSPRMSVLQWRAVK